MDKTVMAEIENFLTKTFLLLTKTSRSDLTRCGTIYILYIKWAARRDSLPETIIYGSGCLKVL